MSEELTLSYRGTLDEAAAAAFRLAEITGEVKRLKWYGLALSPVFMVLVFFIIDESPLDFILGGSLTLLWVVWFLFFHRKQALRQLRGSLRRALGSDDPVQCSYGLTDESIHYTQGKGQEFIFRWDTVKTWQCSDQALEIVMEPAAVIRIPVRVFTEKGMLSEWKSFISSRTGLEEG